MIGAAAPGVAAAYDPNAAAAMYGRGSAPGNDDYCYNVCMLQLPITKRDSIFVTCTEIRLKGLYHTVKLPFQINPFLRPLCCIPYQHFALTINSSYLLPPPPVI